MPDRTRLGAAIHELNAAWKEYVDADNDLSEQPQHAEPYAKFAGNIAWNAQEVTVSVDTNVANLLWVLFADNAQSTWYGDPQPVPESKTWTVKAQRDRDRIKVFVPNGIAVDSQHFLFDDGVDDVPAVVGGDALARVNKYLEGARGGINVERELANEFSQQEWNYLRQQVPCDDVRVFLAWRPEDGIFAGNGGRAWALPSDAFIKSFVDGIVKARNAGYKRVFADCSDVCTDSSFNGNGPELIKQCCVKVCNEIKSRSISPDVLSIGPVNEWATSQANVHRWQNEFHAAMRKVLPQHILGYGPDYWKYWGKLVENQNFQPAKDELSICDVHSYSDMDENGWRWLAGELSKWQQRTKRRVIYGEAGAGQLMRDEQNYDVYPRNLRKMLPIMRPFNPLTWSVNKGGHWKLNWNGAELVNRQSYNNGGHAPDIADALKQGMGL